MARLLRIGREHAVIEACDAEPGIADMPLHNGFRGRGIAGEYMFREAFVILELPFAVFRADGLV
jgi:hypothetical protein